MASNTTKKKTVMAVLVIIWSWIILGAHYVAEVVKITHRSVLVPLKRCLKKVFKNLCDQWEMENQNKADMLKDKQNRDLAYAVAVELCAFFGTSSSHWYNQNINISDIRLISLNQNIITFGLQKIDIYKGNTRPGCTCLLKEMNDGIPLFIKMGINQMGPQLFCSCYPHIARGICLLDVKDCGTEFQIKVQIR